MITESSSLLIANKLSFLTHYKVVWSGDCHNLFYTFRVTLMLMYPIPPQLFPSLEVANLHKGLTIVFKPGALSDVTTELPQPTGLEQRAVI